MNAQELARYIDHTLLKPDATKSQIEALCREAVEYGFWSVCVQPSWVAFSADILKGSQVKVCSVISFPQGVNTSAIKAAEAARAAADGAAEVDMVMHPGLAKAGDWEAVEADITAVVTAVPGTLVKVILETSLLDLNQIAEACRRAEAAGAHYVKTSTGFQGGGATVEHVRLMRSSVGPKVKVKASGGIRDKASALALIEAGASRLGMSSGVAVIQGMTAESGY